RAFGARWFIAMSGPLSVPLAIAGVAVPNWPLKIFLLGTAGACFFFAAYWVWRNERLAKIEATQQVAQIAARLTPKISALYDSKIPSCRAEVEFRDASGQNPVKAICFRLEIRNTGADTVHDCEGHLTEVYYEGENAELAPINLTWTGPVTG